MSRNPLNDPDYEAGEAPEILHDRPGVEGKFWSGLGWGFVSDAAVVLALAGLIWAGTRIDNWLFP